MTFHVSATRFLAVASPLLAILTASVCLGDPPPEIRAYPMKTALPGAVAELDWPEPGPSALDPYSFRELLRDEPEGGRYSVLPRDVVTTPTLEWRESLHEQVRHSPYQDMSLSELIEIAMERNLSLLNSRRSVARAKSSYRGAQAEFIPFVTLLADAAYSDSKASSGPMIRKVRRSEFGTGLDVVQRLPTGGRITGGADLSRRRTVTELRGMSDDKLTDYAANADIGITQPLLRGAGFNVGLADVRQSRLEEIRAEIEDYIRRREIALSVINQFFEIAITLSNIEVSLAALDVKEKFIRDAEIRYEAGQVIPNEISKAEVQFNLEKLNFIRLEQRLKDQTQNMLEILGLPLDTQISFRELEGSLLDSDLAGIPESLAAAHEAVSNRPELLQSDVDIRQREIGLEVAKNDTLPNLDLSASYTDSEVSQDLSRALNLNQRRTWVGGVSLSIPLPNIQRKEARRRAELDLESALTNREILERSIVNDVGALIRELRRSEQSILLLEATVRQAEFNLRQETELFIYGERSSNQVRDAQDDYFEAQANYNRELFTYQVVLAQVYRAVGRPLF